MSFSSDDLFIFNRRPDSFMRGMCVKVRALRRSWCTCVSSPCLGAEGRRPRTRALVREQLFLSCKGARVERKREAHTHTHTSSVFRQPANSAAAGEHWKEGWCLSLSRGLAAAAMKTSKWKGQIPSANCTHDACAQILREWLHPCNCVYAHNCRNWRRPPVNKKRVCVFRSEQPIYSHTKRGQDVIKGIKATAAEMLLSLCFGKSERARDLCRSAGTNFIL